MSTIIAILIISAACVVIATFAFGAIARRGRRRAGYGIRALEGFEADREVSVSVVELPLWTGGWDAGAVSDAAYTIITVPHSAELPWVVEVRDGEASRLDKQGFEVWAKEKHDPRLTPDDIRLPRGSGFEDVAENIVRRALDMDDVFRIKGVVRIEPTQVRYVEQGDLLDPAYLRIVAGVLLQLTDAAEKTSAPAADLRRRVGLQGVDQEGHRLF